MPRRKKEPEITTANSPTVRYIIDYCVANDMPYTKTDAYVMVYYPGEYNIVYFPNTKTFFFSGRKVMENPDLETLQNFLDFVR